MLLSAYFAAIDDKCLNADAVVAAHPRPPAG